MLSQPVAKKPKEEEKVCIVQAISAGWEGGNFAKILINDKPILCLDNKNGHNRGLHIVVLNPKCYAIEWA